MLRSDRLAAESHLCVRPHTGLYCHAHLPMQSRVIVIIIIQTVFKFRQTGLELYSQIQSCPWDRAYNILTLEHGECVGVQNHQNPVEISGSPDM